MYNPFKKKEDDGFQMNNIELPNIGNEPNNFSDDLSMPELPSLNQNPIEPNSQFQNNQDTFGNPNLQSPDQTLENTPGISSLSQSNLTPSFETPNHNDNNNPFTSKQSNTESSFTNNDNQSYSNQDMHNEISKSKLESLGSKMELLEHKVQNIDNKIDLILKLIQAEVSTETKMKTNMEEKMQQFR